MVPLELVDTNEGLPVLSTSWLTPWATTVELGWILLQLVNEAVPPPSPPQADSINDKETKALAVLSIPFFMMSPLCR
jgi:hypothetical protein